MITTLQNAQKALKKVQKENENSFGVGVGVSYSK